MPDSTMLLLYLSVFIGPFVQEDAAVLYAASLSVNEMANWPVLYVVILMGLFFSDIWKYWIGWLAGRYEWAKRITEREQVANLSGKVKQHTFITLVTARFVPLARIPAYVACGLFGVSYPKFCAMIFVTATMYVTVVFTLFHILGEIVGEKLKWVVPLIALGAIGSYILYLLISGKLTLKKTK